MTGEVIVRRAGAAGHISLDRPQALHALTRAMCEAISAALLEWRDDPAVAAVILDRVERLLERNVLAEERGTLRVRDRQTLRYYARTIQHLIHQPKRTTH